MPLRLTRHRGHDRGRVVALARVESGALCAVVLPGVGAPAADALLWAGGCADAHGAALGAYANAVAALGVHGAAALGVHGAAALGVHGAVALGACANAAVALGAHTASAQGASGSARRSTPTRRAPRCSPARACAVGVRRVAVVGSRIGGGSRFRGGRSGHGGTRLRQVSLHNRSATRPLPAQRPSAQVKRQRWQKSAT